MSTGSPDELLTVSEIAETLKVNPQTIRNWIDAGKLNAVRVGARRVRVKRSELDTFLDASSPGHDGSAEPVEAENEAGDLLDRIGVALAESLSADDRAELADRLRIIADALAPSKPRRG